MGNPSQYFLGRNNGTKSQSGLRLLKKLDAAMRPDSTSGGPWNIFRAILLALALPLVCSTLAPADDTNTTDAKFKVHVVFATTETVGYIGSTLGGAGDNLMVSADKIHIEFGGRTLDIDPARVTRMAYCARRKPNGVLEWIGLNAGTMILYGVAGAAVTATGAMIKGFTNSPDHFISIDYRRPNGQFTGLLLKAKKDNYEAVLDALRKVAPEKELSAAEAASNPLGCGPAEEKIQTKKRKDIHPVPAPPPDKALLYFFARKGKNPYGSDRLGVNGRWVGKVEKNSYLFTEVSDLAKVCLDRSSFVIPFYFSVEPGKAYYLGPEGGNSDTISAEQWHQMIADLDYVGLEAVP